MFDVPVTFLYDFDYSDEHGRRCVLREFAENGAKFLVLSDFLIKQMLVDRKFGRILIDELSAVGLAFADSHAPFGPLLDLNCPVPEARPEMLLRHKLSLMMAADMGVRTMTIHVGNENVYPEYSLEEQYDCVKRSLDELLPYAEKLDMTICVENIWTRINTPDRLLGLKKQFPVKSLGFCFDAGHANLMDNGRRFPESAPFRTWKDETPVWEDRALEKMLPHIVNCHLHDNNGISDQHLVPGQGIIDWQHVMGLLARAPELKVIQSEVIPARNGLSIKEVCTVFDRLTAV